MGLLVYSASAGSGKTYTLALKYIAMAVATDRASDFTNILAVTFTNMATAEMKDRILKQLDNLARGGTDKDFLENLIKETQISKDVLVRRAKGVLAAIMHDYDHFRVETIDSFFQTLLTNLAHELKLPRGFKVDLDDKAVVSQSVDRMLLGVGNEANADLTSMIISVLERHIDDDKGWNIAKELKRFAQSNLFRGEYMAHDEEIEEVTSDSKYMGRLHHALRSYIRDFDEKLEDCIARIEPEVEAVAGVKSKATNIRTYEKNLRKHDFSEPAKIIVTMAGNWDAVFNKDCKEKEALRGHAQRISDILKEMEYLRETYASSVYNCELTLKNLDRLSLSGAISREITRYTTEHETFLLARTPELFNRMVKGNDASFVFEKYGTTFKHIMIDEFQDTSRMQWNNFKTLLLENMAQGDESMLVGDIKQSIYRWRGGDWNILFDIKKEFDQADVLPKVENFRSLPVIVRFNNAFFVKASTYIDKRHWEVPGDWICHETKLMPVLPEEVDNSNIIQQIYKDVEQTPRCGEEGTGYVRIVMNDKDTTAEETIEDLYEQAVNLHVEHGVPYGEMLILVRRNSETQTIIDYITEKDPAFPITSAEAFMLKSSLMVTTLINALKFLSDKTDTLAMALLREGLHAIYDKIEDKELRNFYLDMIDGICTTLSDDAQRATMQQMPLYELCLHLMMMHYEEAEKLGELKQSAYIFNFLDALVSYINDHSSDIKDFISFWDDVLSERSIAVNVEDAVRVMTIHKAKGLEGHTVFIPFADFLLENSQHDKIIWCAPQQNMTNDTNVNELVGRLPLVPVNDLKKMEESAYSTFYENEHRQQRVDSLNTLYVAFTRAKCNLFIWSKRPKIGGRSAFNLIDAFVNNLQPSDEKTTTPGVVCYGNIVGAKGTKEAKDEQDTKEISVSISHNDLSGVKFFQSSKALDFLADSEREIEGDTPELQHQRRTRYFMNKGTLYHQVFSLIERKEDVPGVIEKMRAEGLLATKKQADEILTFVTTALQQEKETAKWFDGTYELYNEHNILIRSDGHAKMFRPDRVMVAADHAVVVDYKFGSEKEEYKDQVEMYANNLAKLLNKPVKGYLWYVSKKVIPVCDIELNIK